MHVGIIGAGLGGLTLAHGLIRMGADVAVYERDASPYVRRQGFRITVDEHGFSALHNCLPPDLYAMVDATGGPPGGHFRITDERLRDAIVVDFDAAADAERQIDREVLRAILLLGLADNVHWSSPVLAVEQSATGCRISLEDRTEDFDLVVVADGVGSQLRQTVYPDASPRPLGVGGIYGRSPLRVDGNLLLPDRLLDSGILAMLPKPGLAFFATAMRFAQPVARILPADAVPPGLDTLSDYIMWGLIPDPTETDALAECSSESLLHRAGQLTADTSPVLKALVANARPADTLFSRFSAGRPGGQRQMPYATAIGDSIHPMPPLGAHGGNTALRSAQALMRQLAHHDEIAVAIDAYEADMITYATAVIRDAESQTDRLTRRGLNAMMLRRILPLLQSLRGNLRFPTRRKARTRPDVRESTRS